MSGITKWFLLAFVASLQSSKIITSTTTAFVHFVQPLSATTSSHGTASSGFQMYQFKSNSYISVLKSDQQERRSVQVSSSSTTRVGTRLFATTTKKEDIDQSSSPVYEDATKLLDFVLKRFKQPQENNENDKQNEDVIESLIIKLISTKTSYDPMESLYGPMYCSLYSFTPGSKDQQASQPLWEKISLKKDNLKGQQYVLNKDRNDDINNKNVRQVINYAEIWGNTFHLRAGGYFIPVDENGKEKKVDDDDDDGSNEYEQVRSCPDKYEVFATGAFISVFGNSIKLPIEGSSYLVVGYADPRLRIFVSPKPSESAVGTWEQAGLIVVQVRSDLVTSNQQPINLQEQQ